MIDILPKPSRRSPLLVIAAMLLLIHGALPAQERTGEPPSASVTIGARYGAGGAGQGFQVFAGSDECGMFGRGDLRERSIGAGLRLPDLIGRLGLALRLDYGAASEAFASPATTFIRNLDPGGEPVELHREYRFTSEIRRIELELGATFPAIGRLELGGGARFGYRLGSDFRQVDRIISPSDYRFSDGSSEAPMSEGIGFTAREFRVGLLASAALPIPLGPRLSLQPEIVFSYDPLSPVNEARRSSYGISGGIALRYDLRPRPRSLPADAPLIPPALPRLAASIAIYSVDTAGHQNREPAIRVREVIHRDFAPLLPAVFFDADSSVIPSRYVRLSRDAASLFTVDSFARLDPVGMNHQAMNIIGRRLRVAPAAVVTLHGGRGAGEPAALGMRRAEMVGRYLRTAWGIEEGRIRMETGTGRIPASGEGSADGREENRRVELTGSLPGITGPVATERLVREFDPPLLRMKPGIVAEAGVRDWTITITHGGTEVARYSKSAAGDAGDSAISWRIAADRMSDSLAPLVAEITVIDSASRIATARDEIPLRLESRGSVMEGKRSTNGEEERISYDLVGFDFSSPEPGKELLDLIERVAASVRDSARIEITGYTDRIGDDLRNIDLSRARAERVMGTMLGAIRARGLRGVRLQVTAGGINTSRFTNDLPEGRILSRGASIVIEQER